MKYEINDPAYWRREAIRVQSAFDGFTECHDYFVDDLTEVLGIDRNDYDTDGYDELVQAAILEAVRALVAEKRAG